MLERIRAIFFKEKQVVEESSEVVANRRNLVSGLKAVFVIIPLLKPYNGEYDLVKLPYQYLDIISEVLRSDDEKITQNKLFFEVKELLQDIINNDGIFRIDNTYSEKSSKVEKFCYSLLED